MKIHEIPFRALGGMIDAADVEAVMKTVEAASCPGGNFFPLPEENDFQNAFALHEGAARAIAVNSCGTALDCCMKALGIGPGDEAITTPLTFVCSAGTALGQGARVVFADIDPETWTLSPESVRQRITERTKVIIPVHFAGLSCDIDAFDRITAETGIPVIYDAAHAVGTRYHGKTIGGRGVASCYSFQSNKNMTCLGEGGAVTTDNPEFAEKVRRLKTFGYVYGGASLRVADIGFNYRMTKPQLAMGLTQLAKIDFVIQARRLRMAKLEELLTGCPGIQLPAGHNADHGSHLYVIRVTGVPQPKFVAHLKNEYKVATAKHYPAVWSWEAFQSRGYSAAGCPIAEKVCAEVVTLPVFTDTSMEDIEYIAWAVRRTMEDLG